MMNRALRDSVLKLSPKVQVKNPVMFMVFVSAILTLVLFVLALAGIRDAHPGYLAYPSLHPRRRFHLARLSYAVDVGGASQTLQRYHRYD